MTELTPVPASSGVVVPTAPVPLPAALADGLRVAADAHAESLRPVNTTRSYGSDWRTWSTWCADVAGVSEWSVDASLLEAYCRWMWHERGYAASTIERKLTGVIAGLRRQFGPDAVPRYLTGRARANLAAYVRDSAADKQPKRGRGQAPAADLTVLERLLVAARADPGPAGARDAALILITFGAGCRSVETAGLLAGDVVVDGDRGLLVDIRSSKVASSVRVAAIPRGVRGSTDPVIAWRMWFAVSGLEPGDPAFCRIRKGGRILPGTGLSPEAVSDVIARRSQQADLDRHTAHSLRAGMATVARQAGHDAVAIAAQGGWTPGSRAMSGYLRRVDTWTDNAMRGVL
ncbi:tyrosine-type recombinase/integrase [Stackebrandtia soli]|uniref:tyrosine-type recombinase/integrase n=1 Tax=Stackebrandtia soli TaxID=1892856 RepID=UPI0039E78A82